MTSRDGADRPRGGRARGLTREQIVAAGLALMEERGGSGLAMKQLGDRLGVGTMTVYGYYRSKDELVDDIAVALLARVESPPTGDPAEAIEGIFLGLRDVFAAHPGVLQHLICRPLLDEATLRPIDAAIELLCRMGQSPAEASGVVADLLAVTLGHAALDARRHACAPQSEAGRAHEIEQLATGFQLPSAAAAASAIAAAFERDRLPHSLRRILTGVSSAPPRADS